MFENDMFDLGYFVFMDSVENEEETKEEEQEDNASCSRSAGAEAN